MRVMKLSVVAFCACFLIGLGILALYPATAQAGSAGPNPCYTACTSISCGAPCGDNLYEHYAWHPWALLRDPCSTPFTCGGNYVGCGLLCQPT